MDDQTSWLPDHHVIVTPDNIDAVRSTLPQDQREEITVGCFTWRCPIDVDTWLESCGSTLSYWPRTQRGALYHDGDLDGSSWGEWRGGKLMLDEGLTADVTGHILHVWLGSTSSETYDADS